MEHEDNNTQFDNNFLRGNMDEFSIQQNQQNLVENLQIDSGFGAGGIGGGMVDEIGVGIGGKFEQEEQDEEWKYIKEVQQSEKQQAMKVGEGVGVAVDADGIGGFVEYDEGGDGQMLLPTEVDEEEEAAIIKNDGDFSTTSNTTSTTAGEEENSAAAEEELQQQQKGMDTIVAPNYWQDEIQKKVDTQLLAQELNSPTAAIEESSLATGENCENPQQQQQFFGELHETLTEKIGDNMFSSSSTLAASNANAEHKYEIDKENLNPAVAAVIDPLEDNDNMLLPINDSETTRPSELDLQLDIEMHSNLNPDAKEFVPIHSNPTSPISPEKPYDFLNFAGTATAHQGNASPVIDVGDNKENIELDSNVSDDVDFITADVGEPALSTSSVSPHPNVMPRHLIGATADDVVAQSPRKGRDFNMDAISLPAEDDFEHEAAKRPHEIEQKVILISDGNDGDGGDGKQQDKVKDEADVQIENCENINRGAGDAGLDCNDDKVAEQKNMQIPATDADDYNNFQHPLDHGPETSVDLDMDDQDMMKQSLYIENTAFDAQPRETVKPIEELLNTVQPIPTDSESINNSFADDLLEIPNKELLNVEEKEVISHSPSTEEIQMQFNNELQEAEEMDILPPLDEKNLTDTTNPNEFNESIIEKYSFSTVDVQQPTASGVELLQFADFANVKVANELVTPSSPISTQEKHLIEDTKEDLYLKDGMDELEQEMINMLLDIDGNQHKADEIVAQPATPINEEHIGSSPVLNEPLQQRQDEPFYKELQPELQSSMSPMFERSNDQQEPEVIFVEESPIEESVITPGSVSRTETPLVAASADIDEVPILLATSPSPSVESPQVLETAVPDVVHNEVAAATENVAAANIVASAAVAATVVATAATTIAKKSEPSKKPLTGKTTSTTAKSKVNANNESKKLPETKKPATGVGSKTPSTAAKSSTSMSRPRPAPTTAAIKTAAGSAEKKTASSSTLTARPATHAAPAKKPMTNKVAAAKPAATKTAATRPTTLHKTVPASGTIASRNGVAAKTAAPRPATAPLASRKSATSTTAALAHGNASQAAAKARPTTATPATKPSTLALTAKPKPALSPRATLTSQLRKSGPTTSATAAKSPMKTTAAPTTNGIGKPIASTNSTANRTKTTTTTTTTKTFTARPAPKTTSSHSTITVNTASRSTTGSATKTTSSSSSLRKSSPSKPASATAAGKESPTKSNAIGRPKTKDALAVKTTTEETAAEAIKNKQLNDGVELVDPPKINGNACVAGEPLVHTENGGTHLIHGGEENGLVEQGEMALIDGTAA